MSNTRRFHRRAVFRPLRKRRVTLLRAFHPGPARPDPVRQLGRQHGVERGDVSWEIVEGDEVGVGAQIARLPVARRMRR